MARLFVTHYELPLYHPSESEKVKVQFWNWFNNQKDMSMVELVQGYVDIAKQALQVQKESSKPPKIIHPESRDPYFVSYGTKINEFQIWHYAIKRYSHPEQQKIIDWLKEEAGKTKEKPRVIVVGFPDLEKKITEELEKT